MRLATRPLDATFPKPYGLALALLGASASLVVAPSALAQDAAEPCATVADTSARRGVLVGRVLDAASGAAVPGAVVTLYWRVTSIGDEGTQVDAVERIVRADSLGRFRSCGLPTGASLLAWAEVAEARSVPAEVTLPSGDSLTFEFRVPAGAMREAAAARPAATTPVNARISGVVRTDHRAPIAGARVRLALGGREVRTDSAGRFQLAVVGPGAGQLDVIALGFAPGRRWVEWTADRTTHVDVELGVRVRTLDEVLVVTTSAFVRDFESRRRRGGGGHFVDRARIEEDRSGSIMNLALAIPALRVNHDGTGRMLETMRRGRACPVAVYLDGSPIDQIQLDALVAPAQLYGIEYYPGFAAPPIQHTAFARSECGTMLLWTKEFAGRRTK